MTEGYPADPATVARCNSDLAAGAPRNAFRRFASAAEGGLPKPEEMTALPERRRTTRIKTAIEAGLRGADGAVVPAQIENLSVVGLLATVPHSLALGSRYRVELRTGNDAIEAHGTVVRSLGRSLALRFEFLPFESYERLRAFLLSHADDPAVIVEELNDRIGHLGESA